jgi:hypothetical protein
MYRAKHAKRRAKFSFASCLIERPRFVATKKMTLLSCNPDGLAFVFGFKSLTKGAIEYRSIALSLSSIIEAGLNFVSNLKCPAAYVAGHFFL